MIAVLKNKRGEHFMGIEGIELNEGTNAGALGTNRSPLSAGEKDQLDRIQSAAKTINRNPVKMMIEAALTYDKAQNKKINDNITKATDFRNSIDLLVDLNGKLSLYSDNENEKAITPEIREIFQKLKAKGMDILPEKETKLSRERLAEIKATISAHTERVKTDLQVLMATEIQVDIQVLQTVLDCAKKSEENYRLTRVIQNLKLA